ncbi:hypothetical protein Poli38472_012207 [Pythium oligandrum]|uniref:Uncharacterized protein n=1 Tax=Pythium oligandrum TaxID=41045 RepID=A0A8K1CR08_PYTOL|nr:hypothetical protein Poli38472_012207 [Pythium oligandrum]|eukprot:TMW67091.1 hypothetical protein Poli38472_012207 [Pythium oligandrum]
MNATSTWEQDAAPGGYRSTYYARKNEITTLEAEADMLTQQIKQIKAEQGVMAAALHDNTLLRPSLQVNAWALAEAQSVLTNRMAAQGVHPLATYIHLTADPAQRQYTLQSLRDQKLRDATEFLIRRTRFVDLCRSHRQVDTSEMPNGDVEVEQFVVIPFPGVSSVKIVYEGLGEALSNQQFVVWEQLGATSVSDFEGIADKSIRLLRHVTKVAPGVEMEKNGVSFRQYYEKSDLVDGPYGLTVMDFVDQDELHPYQPTSRVRLDVTSALMVCHSGDASVSFVRWTRSCIHRPHESINPHVVESLRDFIPRWAEATHKAIREHVALTQRSRKT